jgi:hypothetical protein
MECIKKLGKHLLIKLYSGYRPMLFTLQRHKDRKPHDIQYTLCRVHRPCLTPRRSNSLFNHHQIPTHRP